MQEREVTIDLDDLEAKARAATKGEWEFGECENRDDRGKFTSYSVEVRPSWSLKYPKTIVDTLNSGVMEVQTEHDEYDSSSWDEQGCKDAAYIVAAQPSVVLGLIAQVRGLEEALREAKRTIAACDWYWPESDTSSDMCCTSAQEVIEGGLPGEVYGVARGGIVDVTYCSYLFPADDADSDDKFWVEEKTEKAAKAAIEAELARRAALGGGNG